MRKAMVWGVSLAAMMLGGVARGQQQIEVVGTPELGAEYDQMLAKAPAKYPEVFIVTQSSEDNEGCGMTLESRDKVVYAYAPASFMGNCTPLSTGTIYYARVHHILGWVVDILVDPPKGSKRYQVQGIENR